MRLAHSGAGRSTRLIPLRPDEPTDRLRAARESLRDLSGLTTYTSLCARTSPSVHPFAMLPLRYAAKIEQTAGLTAQFATRR